MRSSLLSKPALIMAAGVALAGLYTMAGTAGAAARSVPASHRGMVRPASHSIAQRATGFANWQMFRGNLAHTGVSPETGINTTNASTLTAGWSASVASASYSSPAVVNLAATGTPTVFVGGLGMFAAYPASGGAPLWTFPVNKMVNASPAVLNGVVYFSSTDGTLYAVNAKNGALLCSYDTGQFSEGSPLVVEAPDGSGPVIYEGTAPAGTVGFEWAIYGPGNTHGSCTVDWTFHGWTITDTGTWSPPAYGTNANGVPVVVFGSDDPDNSVYALNATTGARIWRVITNRTFYASPAVVGPPGEQVLIIANITGHIFALDLATGKTLWTQAADSAGIWSSPTVSQNTIYITGKDGQLVTFTPSGA